jgi:secreted Zn-dependent insulinase-like peptidase
LSKQVTTSAKMAVEIVKPRNDKREYRRVVLPNSLEVCLISDPDTDKVSSFSFSVLFDF